jgi:hypothetical protein
MGKIETTAQDTRKISRVRTHKAIPLAVAMSVTIGVAQAGAHEPHVCPPGTNDTPALAAHVHQKDLLKMPFRKVFKAGQRLFVTDFNACDGAGRPGTNGGIVPRTPNPLRVRASRGSLRPMPTHAPAAITNRSLAAPEILSQMFSFWRKTQFPL